MKTKWHYFTVSELIAIITVAVIIGIVLTAGPTIFSPGPLNAQIVQDSNQVSSQTLNGVTSHAELKNQCGSCHAPPWGSETMAQLCLSCHTGVEKELENPHDLHYMTIASIKSLTCTNECHTEHNGPKSPVTLVKSEHFNISTGLAYSVEGHKTKSDETPFNCADCHLNGLEKFKLETCTTCHEQIDSIFTQKHIDTFGQDCLKCHDGLDTYGKAFDHNQADFRLSTAHSSPSAECGDCHNNARTVEDLKSLSQDCNSCHQKDDEHKGDFGSDCTECHNDVDWKQITYDHQNTDYPLSGKHSTTDCLSCHVDNTLKDLPQDCSSCHQKDDEHEGKLNDCADCHTESDWKVVTFDHQTTEYPLTGEHTTVDCTSCHVDNVYKDTPQDCYSCHEEKDEHKRDLGQDCVQCHTTSDWKEVTFDHETSAYPLTGAHATTECTSCHSNGVLKGTPDDCYSCHAEKDEHKGDLGQDCVQCHTTSGWKEITFDHETSAYPLTGAHATTDCTSCHINGVLKGTPKDCYSCHATKDEHKGDLGQDCVQCHTTSDWKDVIFDHDKTGFPLIEGHAAPCTSCHTNGQFKQTPQDCSACHGAPLNHYGLSCSSCHNITDWRQARINHSATAFPLTGAHTSAPCSSCHVSGVYKGTPTSCYSCHQTDSAQVHTSAVGQNCASCHNTSSWSGATINHSTTVFPLTGSHTRVSCTSCHSNGFYKGTSTSCYSCHRSDDEHNGRNGTDCARCHDPSGWD